MEKSLHFLQKKLIFNCFLLNLPQKYDNYIYKMVRRTH